ncbi:hypothetical protein ElyMa_002403300 [Elysia marginata]|uniref:RNase H type-1 domain-containing protein n=1 Tax=Elysia marginata TaxID=1093978 RepID=A0AAV4GFN6_9GAST|nr:hypothetical protein ElyMa_002403300 [Elysia marginata]
METISGLQSLEERRETKTLTKRQKYKAIPNSVLNRRLKDTNKGRLKRNSFYKKYPIKESIRIYTDGSATDAVRNGGGGVYATLPDGTTLKRSFACGMRYTNYKAETEATKEALNMVNNKISKTSKVVILSDASSVLQT